MVLELHWHILIYRHSRFGLAKNVSGLTRTGSRNGNGRRLCHYPGFRSRQRILFNRQWAPAIIRLSMPITPEDRARQSIDQLLTAAGWIIQNRDAVNITAGRGVAVREFPMKKGHGEADYLLFVDGAAAGVVEAKKEGETLTGVEIQTTHGGGGISIGFDAVSLHLNMLQLGIVTVKVVYDEERQQKLISGLLDYLLHGDLPAAEERLTRIQVAKIELYQILSFVAPAFKHPAFKEEAEWRLIYSGEYFDLIRQFGVPIGLKPSTQFPTLYRETPRELVPYVALPLAATGQSLELASVTDLPPIFSPGIMRLSPGLDSPRLRL